MEAVKLGRRRISDIDCDGYRPMKRRMNGMCHLEGGGGGAGNNTNWHMNLETTQQQQQQQQHLSSIAHPVLPPNLRESERMQSVERWINNIPLDAPIYVQTSLTQIVPITDPKSFPDELSVSDHLPSAPNNSAADTSRGVSGYEYYSQQTQVGGAGGGVTSRGNTTTASTSGNHHHHHHPHLGPPPQQPPGGGSGGYQARAATGYHGNNGSQPPLHPPLPPPPPAPPGPLADNQGIRARSFTRGPSNRFFNDYETQFVVKLFRDFFANGSCPSLNEVRRRIAHSQLQGRRNANSVRAKVKRLQASGRWKDFEVLP
ncbi:hypothetical protein Aperf_G00000078335 [Anoplocephala perfoliata]